MVVRVSRPAEKSLGGAMGRVDRRLLCVLVLISCRPAVSIAAQTRREAAPSFVETSQFDEAPGAVSESSPVFEVEQVVGQPAGPPPTPRHTGIKAMLKDLAVD